MKEVKIPDTENSVELYLFDISGNDLYKNIREKYVRFSFFFVFVRAKLSPSQLVFCVVIPVSLLRWKVVLPSSSSMT
jgi:hypothetical protein